MKSSWYGPCRIIFSKPFEHREKGRKLRSKEYFCSNCGTPRPETEMKEVRVSSWKATLALILGIISMIAPFFALIWPIAMGVLGLTSSIVAIVFAILSRKETNHQLSGIALVGMILAILGLCIALIVLMLLYESSVVLAPSSRVFVPSPPSTVTFVPDSTLIVSLSVPP